MRCALLLVGLLLVGCGAAPNASATQTRTSEIVELTVAARLLPTANAAIPPTPVPVAATPPLAASVSQAPTPTNGSTVPGNASATTLWATINAMPTQPSGLVFGGPGPTVYIPPLPGSWVAYSPAIRVRFFAPPALVEDPERSSDHRYALASPSNVFDFETLDIYRYVGARGGDFARTWSAEMDAFSKATNVGVFSVTSSPRQQQVAAYQGNVGQFHYSQNDNGLPISGTMWVGRVGGDEAVIIYRCTPERERFLDEEIAQVFWTIDFNAR